MAEKLREYKRKRDPKQTPEPFTSKRGGRTKAPIFVVQRHDARRLHYDFRLERNGALASWAVPKGVPLEPGQRVLAVHVEDHPLDYATFAGEIPKGNYGAGTVEIWDNGTYELVEEKPDGGLTVRLHGSRLEGTWTLVPAHLDGDPKNWLLIRKRDDETAAAKGGFRNDYRPMLATLAEAVPTRRRLALRDQVGRVPRARLRSRGRGAPRVAQRQRSDGAVPGRREGAREGGPLPELRRRRRGVRTRRRRAAELLGDAAGEARHADRLRGLRRPRDRRRAASSTCRSRSGANGWRSCWTREQKTMQISAAFDDGEGLYEAALERRLEGVMAKRRGSRYLEGKRSRDWLKVKTHGREEFVICGWTKGQGKRAGRFGSLVLGTYRGNELHWVGNCGTGFTERDIDELLHEARAVAPRHLPVSRRAEDAEDSQGRRRVGRAEARLRGGVRRVDARRASAGSVVPGTARGQAGARRCDREQPVEKSEGRVKLSNLDKVFWPDEGITKGDLLDYYRAVAPVILPHLRDRPFTMRRYPDGIAGKAFFQKDAPTHMPEWIPRFRVEVSTRDKPRERRWIEAPIVNDEDALLWAANMACIDMNVWYSRVDRPDRPDFVLFDLDPSPDVGFKETVQVALLVKEALDALGLQSFAKTSSADGMHVLVPVERRYTFDDTREFSEIIAGAIARTHRGLATTEWSKAKRRGVLIDSNQNGEGKTIASVYSVRPRPGAPVSTPLRWDEVSESLDPSAFTMDVVLERVQAHGDLFAGVLTTKQRLDRALNALR